MTRTLLALLICALSGTAAYAAEPPAPTAQQALDACRALENPLERLACYDSIPGASVTGGAASAPSEIPSAAGPLFGKPHETPFLRSRMTRRWELDDVTDGGLFRVRRHNPVYALPVRFSTSPNEQPESPTLGAADVLRLNAVEAKFQVSLKTKVWDDLVDDNGDVWVGYTQQSNWQAYDDIDSSPFRETNYSPEIWTSWRTGVDLAVMRWQMLNLGFIHQSNGQGGA
ncbi:MAG: phospholipase A, partial [Candidatus Wenzhouxiangella sp. M2_3B_020]